MAPENDYPNLPPAFCGGNCPPRVTALEAKLVALENRILVLETACSAYGNRITRLETLTYGGGDEPGVADGGFKGDILRVVETIARLTEVLEKQREAHSKDLESLRDELNELKLLVSDAQKKINMFWAAGGLVAAFILQKVLEMLHNAHLLGS